MTTTSDERVEELKSEIVKLEKELKIQADILTNERKKIANNLEEVLVWFKLVSGEKINLKNFGVKKEEIPNIVNLATTGGRMDNNPIVFSEEEIQDILNCCYK